MGHVEEAKSVLKMAKDALKDTAVGFEDRVPYEVFSKVSIRLQHCGLGHIENASRVRTVTRNAKSGVEPA